MATSPSKIAFVTNCVADGCMFEVVSKGHHYKRKYCDYHFVERLREAGRLAVKKRWVLTERYVDRYGYARVRVPGTLRHIAEHKMVMEQMLGRPMRKGESVHHKNGVRDDNRPENLELWVGAIRFGQRAFDVCCHHCGTPYLLGPVPS